MLDPSRELPNDPHELACLGEDPNLLVAVRNKCWNKLGLLALKEVQDEVWPMPAFEILADRIQSWAQLTVIAMGLRDVERLIQEAPGLIRLKIEEWGPDEGDLRAWCHTVLHNEWIDEIRYEERRRAVSLEACGYEPSVPKDRGPAWLHDDQLTPEECSAELNDFFVRVREALDYFAEFHAPAGCYNYYAVFLVHLLQVIAEHLQRPGRGADTAEMVPWRSEDGSLSFLPGWPILEIIRKALVEAFDADPLRSPLGPVVCETITSLHHTGKVLTVTQWQAMTSRARKKAREYIPNWDLFSRFMVRPTYHPRRTEE